MIYLMLISTKYKCDGSSATLLELQRPVVGHTYWDGLAATAPMDPFQRDEASLDDEAFLASWTAGAHGRAPPDQDVQAFAELPISTPSIRQVQTC